MLSFFSVILLTIWSELRPLYLSVAGEQSALWVSGVPIRWFSVSSSIVQAIIQQVVRERIARKRGLKNVVPAEPKLVRELRKPYLEGLHLYAGFRPGRGRCGRHGYLAGHSGRVAGDIRHDNAGARPQGQYLPDALPHRAGGVGEGGVHQLDVHALASDAFVARDESGGEPRRFP